jgi:hypothetical protein
VSCSYIGDRLLAKTLEESEVRGGRGITRDRDERLDRRTLGHPPLESRRPHSKHVSDLTACSARARFAKRAKGLLRSLIRFLGFGFTRAAPAFNFCRMGSAVWSSMSFRFSVPTLAICLMVVGCVNSPPESASEARMWRAQLARQQEAVRNSQGRIGYIGYEGPSSR